MRAVFTYDYGEGVFDELRSAGYEVIYVPERELGLFQELDRTEILVCYNPFDTIDVSALSNLKYLMLSSIGFDQVPLLLRNKKDLIITNNAGGYSVPMGEWIVMMLIMGFKNGLDLVKNSLNRNWVLDTSLLELSHKKIVFLGTGTIAIEATKRLRGFECECIGLNTTGHEVTHFDTCMPLELWPQIVKEAHAVICCLPLTTYTEHMLDDEFFQTINPKAIFINVSRGAVLDEKALLNALNQNKLRFCALDVFEHEPLQNSHPFYSFDRVLITSHQSWVSEFRNQRRLSTILENFRCISAGTALKNTVNLAKGY